MRRMYFSNTIESFTRIVTSPSGIYRTNKLVLYEPVIRGTYNRQANCMEIAIIYKTQTVIASP